jgi:hypothetical protein
MARGSGRNAAGLLLYGKPGGLRAKGSVPTSRPALAGPRPRADWPPGIEGLDAKQCLELLGSRSTYENCAFPRGFKNYQRIWSSFGVRHHDQWGEQGLGWRWIIAVGGIREGLPGNERRSKEDLVICTLRCVGRGSEIAQVMQRMSHGDDLQAAIDYVGQAEAEDARGPNPPEESVQSERCCAAWGVARGLAIARPSYSGWESLENYEQVAR